MSTNTITIDNDNNAVSAIDNGEVSEGVSVSLIRKLDSYCRRPKHFPKVGTRIGNRRVTAIGEDREGFLVVALLCDNGHRTYRRWYGLTYRSAQCLSQVCAECSFEKRRRLSNSEAKTLLDTVQGVQQ